MAAFAQILPLDAERRAEYRISQAFLGRALDNPALAAVATATAAGIRADVTRAVENGKACGEVAAEVDAAAAGLGLVGLVDGIAARIYHEPDVPVGRSRMPAAALAVLRDRASEIFAGECRHYRR